MSRMVMIAWPGPFARMKPALDDPLLVKRHREARATSAWCLTQAANLTRACATFKIALHVRLAELPAYVGLMVRDQSPELLVGARRYLERAQFARESAEWIERMIRHAREQR